MKIVVSCPDEATVAAPKRQSDSWSNFAALESFECGVNAQKLPVSATSVIGKVEIFMELQGPIDVDVEREKRLRKQEKKLEGLLEVVSRKLETADFLARGAERDRPARIARQKDSRRNCTP